MIPVYFDLPSLFLLLLSVALALSSCPVPLDGISPESGVIKRLKNIVKEEIEMVFPCIEETAVKGGYSPLNHISDHKK